MSEAPHDTPNRTQEIIIYSHGFGTHQDDRGLFTDIRDALSDAYNDRFIPYLFDYGDIDEIDNTSRIPPFSAQTQKLLEMIKQARSDHPGRAVNLICHSQGCLIAALAGPQEIKRTLFLAPSIEHGKDHLVKLFGGRAGSHIDLAGLSRLPRRDGSTTLVGPEFWDEYDALDKITAYNELADDTDLVIIKATADEVLDLSGYAKLDPSIRIIEQPANQDFTGAARQPLIKTITHELTRP
jgi:hypothetical protein